ncbi:MAG: hypothetical protein ABI927_08805, partial [Gaiellaceae bacterium]
QLALTCTVGCHLGKLLLVPGARLLGGRESTFRLIDRGCVPSGAWEGDDLLGRRHTQRIVERTLAVANRLDTFGELLFHSL